MTNDLSSNKTKLRESIFDLEENKLKKLKHRLESASTRAHTHDAVQEVFDAVHVCLEVCAGAFGRKAQTLRNLRSKPDPSYKMSDEAYPLLAKWIDAALAAIQEEKTDDDDDDPDGGCGDVGDIGSDDGDDDSDDDGTDGDYDDSDGDDNDDRAKKDEKLFFVGHIYIMRDGQRGTVATIPPSVDSEGFRYKVGRTYDTKKRLSVSRTTNPEIKYYKIFDIERIDGARFSRKQLSEIEKACHKKLKRHQMEDDHVTEWFVFDCKKKAYGAVRKALQKTLDNKIYKLKEGDDDIENLNED